MQKDFYINDQFLVKPGANLVIDGLISKISRVEPLVMQLLCVLAEKNGKPVSREELISEVWKNDPEAEAQLEPGITILRKLLQDETKNLIRSSGKKGYALHASVINADIDDLRNEAKASGLRPAPKTAAQKWILILSILIVLLLIGFAAFNYTYSSAPSPASSHIPYPDLEMEAAHSNDTNTIFSLGPDSMMYKLVLKNEQPQFFVNGRELSRDKWKPYQSLINSLTKQLKDKQGER